MFLRLLIVRLQTIEVDSVSSIAPHSCRKTRSGLNSARSSIRCATEPLRQFHVINRKQDTARLLAGGLMSGESLKSDRPHATTGRDVRQCACELCAVYAQEYLDTGPRILVVRQP